MDKKRKALSAETPIAAAMHGIDHMDEGVGKMMEIAGTKSARQKSVAVNKRMSVIFCFCFEI